MSNEAARTILSVASELLEKANNLIEDENKIFIFKYPLDRCPDSIIKKWMKGNEKDMSTLTTYLELQRELLEREKLGIKIEELKWIH